MLLESPGSTPRKHRRKASKNVTSEELVPMTSVQDGNQSPTNNRNATLQNNNSRYGHDTELKHQQIREQTIRSEMAKLFYKSVVENDVPRMVSLIENPMLDLNWRNEEDGGRTVLHVATQNGNTMVVALLLGKGADICVRDSTGKSPLNIALDMNHKDILQLLANVTLSTLEEAKSRAQNAIVLNGDRKARNEQLETLELLVHYRKYYKEPSDTVVDAKSITNQLQKIFDRPSSPSIFFTHHKRKSPMTEMLTISHFQTIHNIFVAVFLISLTNTLISNFYDSGRILDFDILVWSFGDLPNALAVWLGLFLVSFTAFFLQKSVVLHLLPPHVSYGLYIMLLVALNTAVPYYVRQRNYPPATASIVMCELVRLCMKMHSYLSINNLLRLAKEAGDKDPALSEYPANCTFSNYLYFLWVPTLVYQTSYPRTKRIRWSFVFYSLGEAMLCIVYVYAVFVRYMYPYRNDMIGDYQTLFLGIFKVMIPCIAISLLVFYLLLHSWFNAFAELFTFADRHFYSDWWNVTNWAQYYRKWNFVVHNFLHRHLFTELMVNWHYSKALSMWVTFVLSAVIHEYIIAVCLGFYKPILFIMFVVPGILFIYLTKLFQNHQIANVFFWTMMIIGHGMLFGLYYRQWYFYQNVPNYGHDSLWSLIWVL